MGKVSATSQQKRYKTLYPAYASGKQPCETSSSQWKYITHRAGTVLCRCTASTTNTTRPRLELEQHTARFDDTPDAQWAARRRSAAWSWQAPARRTPIDRDESPAGSATNAIGSSSSAAAAPADRLVVMIRTGADPASTAYPSRTAADLPPNQRCSRQVHGQTPAKGTTPPGLPARRRKSLEHTVPSVAAPPQAVRTDAPRPRGVGRQRCNSAAGRRGDAASLPGTAAYPLPEPGTLGSSDCRAQLVSGGPSAARFSGNSAAAGTAGAHGGGAISR